MAEAIAAAASAVISYVGSAMSAAAAGTATAAQLATAIAVNVAASAAISAVGMAMTKPYLSSNVIATDWIADPNAPIPVVAGRMKVPGNLVYKKAYGDENMYRGIVGVWSVGPIEAVETIKADGSVVTFGSSQMANAPIGDKMWFDWRRGLWSDTALASPASLRGGVDIPQWTPNHRLPCLASYMVTFGHDAKAKVWTNGEPEFASILRGAWAYDPRKDATYPGGSGSHRLDQPLTWEYTRNPALWALKWQVGVYMGANNGRPYVDTLALGIGTPWEDIIVSDFVEAANAADALGLTCAARPTSGDSKEQVYRAFLQAAGAAPRTVNGKQGCSLRVGSKVSLYTLTRDDLAGEFKLRRSPSRLERHNRIQARYRSPDHDWEMVTATAVERAEYLAEDGGRSRSREVEYYYVDDLDAATLLAACDVADSREGWIGGIPCMPWLRDLEPGDCFDVADDIEIIGGVKFRIQTRDFSVGTGVVALGVQSETDEKHAWISSLTGSVTDPTTFDPPGGDFPAPDSGSWSLSAFEQGGGLMVSGGEDVAGARSLIVDYRPDGTTTWIPWAEVRPDSEAVPISGLDAGAYGVQLRWRSDATGSPGAPLVLGPETTGGVVIDWTDQAPIDPDLLDDWNVLRREGGGVYEGALDATNDGAVIALADTLGPLATSTLSEDKVQGRFLGYHAGDAAAVTAGLQDGDAYVDTSVTPPAFKVQAGGDIQEVDTSGTFRDYAAQADITASPGTFVTVAEVDLTNITADSFVTVWMSMAVEVTPDRTRKSGGSAGVNPTGSWRVLECATGAANPAIDPVLMSGSWLAQRVGSGAGADNIDYFDIDGSANAASDISRRWLVRASGDRTWYLQMSKTGSESLLDAGVTLYAQIQRNPLQ